MCDSTSNRRARRPAATAGALALAAALALASVPARAADEEGCLGCHGLEGFAAAKAGGAVRSLAIPTERFAAAAHAPVACRDCHADIASIPHGEGLREVGCGQACHLSSTTGKEYSHEALYWEYAASVHGSRREPRIGCLLCHPEPQIAETERRDKILEARRCAACHGDSPAVREWFGDVHYLALARGDQRAPSCPDCHSAHRVWPAEAKESTVSPRRLAETCGRGAIEPGGRPCHAGLSESSVRGARMNQLPRGEGGRAPGAFALLSLALLAGLVVRAGIGAVRWR